MAFVVSSSSAAVVRSIPNATLTTSTQGHVLKLAKLLAEHPLGRKLIMQLAQAQEAGVLEEFEVFSVALGVRLELIAAAVQN
jgi:hypothetical protein